MKQCFFLVYIFLLSAGADGGKIKEEGQESGGFEKVQKEEMSLTQFVQILENQYQEQASSQNHLNDFQIFVSFGMERSKFDLYFQKLLPDQKRKYEVLLDCRPEFDWSLKTPDKNQDFFQTPKHHKMEEEGLLFDSQKSERFFLEGNRWEGKDLFYFAPTPPQEPEVKNLLMSQPLSQRQLFQGPLSQGLLSQGPLSQGLLSQGPLSQGLLSQGPLSQGPLSQGVFSILPNQVFSSQSETVGQQFFIKQMQEKYEEALKERKKWTYENLAVALKINEALLRAKFRKLPPEKKQLFESCIEGSMRSREFVQKMEEKYIQHTQTQEKWTCEELACDLGLSVGTFRLKFAKICPTLKEKFSVFKKELHSMISTEELQKKMQELFKEHEVTGKRWSEKEIAECFGMSLKTFQRKYALLTAECQEEYKKCFDYRSVSDWVKDFIAFSKTTNDVSLLKLSEHFHLTEKRIVFILSSGKQEKKHIEWIKKHFPNLTSFQEIFSKKPELSKKEALTEEFLKELRPFFEENPEKKWSMKEISDVLHLSLLDLEKKIRLLSAEQKKFFFQRVEKVGKSDTVEERKQNLIDVLQENPGLSRTELQKKTNLGMGTLGKLILDLKKDNLYPYETTDFCSFYIDLEPTVEKPLFFSLGSLDDEDKKEEKNPRFFINKEQFEFLSRLREIVFGKDLGASLWKEQDLAMAMSLSPKAFHKKLSGLPENVRIHINSFLYDPSKTIYVEIQKKGKNTDFVFYNAPNFPVGFLLEQQINEKQAEFLKHFQSQFLQIPDEKKVTLTEMAKKMEMHKSTFCNKVNVLPEALKKELFSYLAYDQHFPSEVTMYGEGSGLSFEFRPLSREDKITDCLVTVNARQENFLKQFQEKVIANGFLDSKIMISEASEKMQMPHYQMMSLLKYLPSAIRQKIDSFLDFSPDFVYAYIHKEGSQVSLLFQKELNPHNREKGIKLKSDHAHILNLFQKNVMQRKNPERKLTFFEAAQKMRCSSQRLQSILPSFPQEIRQIMSHFIESDLFSTAFHMYVEEGNVEMMFSDLQHHLAQNSFGVFITENQKSFLEEMKKKVFSLQKVQEMSIKEAAKKMKMAYSLFFFRMKSLPLQLQNQFRQFFIRKNDQKIDEVLTVIENLDSFTDLSLTFLADSLQETEWDAYQTLWSIYQLSEYQEMFNYLLRPLIVEEGRAFDVKEQEYKKTEKKRFLQRDEVKDKMIEENGDDSLFCLETLPSIAEDSQESLKRKLSQELIGKEVFDFSFHVDKFKNLFQEVVRQKSFQESFFERWDFSDDILSFLDVDHVSFSEFKEERPVLKECVSFLKEFSHHVQRAFEWVLLGVRNSYEKWNAQNVEQALGLSMEVFAFLTSAVPEKKQIFYQNVFSYETYERFMSRKRIHDEHLMQ
jgi:transposase